MNRDILTRKKVRLKKKDERELKNKKKMNNNRNTIKKIP